MHMGCVQSYGPEVGPHWEVPQVKDVHVFFLPVGKSEEGVIFFVST